MQSKDIETSDSLQVEESQFPFSLTFFKEEQQSEQIILHLLTNYKEDEDGALTKMQKIKSSLQDHLQGFQMIEKYHVQKHDLRGNLRKYIQCSCQDMISIEDGGDSLQEMQMLKKFYVQQLELKLLRMIDQVEQCRNKMKLLREGNEREKKINLLTFKIYNIKNYIQQLQVVKNLTQKVENNVKRAVPDFRALEHFCQKEKVPYTFYQQYCLNNCCRVIQKRMEAGQLVMLVHSQSNYRLLKHFIPFFFQNKDIYQHCRLLIRMSNYIRMGPKDALPIQNGFIIYFKPFFISSLLQLKEIDSTNFLKARSMMQSKEQTIDIWREFEVIKVEDYTIWVYEHVHSLKNSLNVHLNQVKALMNIYEVKYRWIEHVNNVEKDLFPSIYLKAALIQIFQPLILYLFFSSIPNQALLSKHRSQYSKYFLYTLFRNCQHLFHFIQKPIMKVVQQCQYQSKDSFFNQNELSSQQYYDYYMQLPAILEESLKDRVLAKQFGQFWRELVVRFEGRVVRKKKYQFGEQFEEEYTNRMLYKRQEQKLVAMLATKKKDQSLKQQIYSLFMKLHFNSLAYFQLKESIKVLGKEFEAQINKIRDLAYNQMFV